MLSIEQLREKLPNKGKDLTDEQVTKLRDDMDQLAGIMFDMWLKKRNNNAINRTDEKNTR